MQLNVENPTQANQIQAITPPQFLHEIETDSRSRKQVLLEIHLRFQHAFPKQTPFCKNQHTVARIFEAQTE